MLPSLQVSRRKFLQSVSMAATGLALPGRSFAEALVTRTTLPPLMQFDYGDVVVARELHEEQLDDTLRVLVGLSDDS